MAHGENVNSIEVEAPKLFDRMARRFNVDYAFYKTGPDKYLLFFKAGQADAITACFERYSRRLLEQSKSSRIPIREQLKKAAEQLVKEPPKTQERTKEVVREERYRVDELRVGGQTQHITVQPKTGTPLPAYEVRANDGARARPGNFNQSDSVTAPRVWNLRQF